MSRSLLKNQQGAISIVGLFFVLLATGLVFGIWGVTNTLVQREGLQDAADAAIFSSAVLHARGMNLMAFLNLVMAVLVAVLIAIRLAQALCIMAATICFALAFFTGGSTAAVGAALQVEAITLQNAFESAKRVIFPLLTALNRTEKATSVVVPWVATSGSIWEAIQYQPSADLAVALPGATQLPVETDEFPVLCEHGGRMAGDLATLPLAALGVGDSIRKPISDAAGGLAALASGFLCGDGTGTPPTYSRTVEEVYPQPPELDQCRATGDAAMCEEAGRIIDEARPDPRLDGQYLGRLGDDHPYVRMERAARIACEPGHTGKVLNYVWQRKDIKATFQRRLGQWVEQSREEHYDLIGDDASEQSSTPPCGTWGHVDQPWNRDSGPFVEGKDPVPLCASQRPSLGNGREGQTRETSWREVSRIFSCKVEVTHEVELAQGKDAFGKNGSPSRSPHRIQKTEVDGEKQTLPLGSEPFRIRGLALGHAPSLGPAEGWVRLAGRTGNSDGEILQKTVGALGVAQAEYYFDHDGDRDPAEWLWDLRWTARLTRFRRATQEERDAEEQRKQGGADARQKSRDEFGGKDEDSSLGDECQAREDEHHPPAPAANRNGAASGTKDNSTPTDDAPGNPRCDDLETNLGKLDDLILH